MTKALNPTYPIGLAAKCCAYINGQLVVLTLKNEIGDGAQGKVFRAQSRSGDYAVKIYSEETLANERKNTLMQKLALMLLASDHFNAWMAAGKGERNEAVLFAWPIATVHKGTTAQDLVGAKFVGMVMPLYTSKLTTFYDVVKRARVHGAPTFEERLAICYFLAKGFATLHAGLDVVTPKGKLLMTAAVGDVDHDNICVTETNQVVFLDCDSCVLRVGPDVFNDGARTEDYSSPAYLSSIAAHTGKAGASYARSPADDVYGMAVLMFRLLNDWNRPYLFDRGPTSARDAIKKHRFPYARISGDKVVPKAEPILKVYQKSMDDRTKTLFERTFLPGSNRPTATEWAHGLREFLRSRPQLQQRPRAAPATSVQQPSAPIAHVEPPSAWQRFGVALGMSGAVGFIVVLSWLAEHHWHF